MVPQLASSNRDSKYDETGTLRSGYAEDGPYHCEDCIHIGGPGENDCMHPEVMKDPELIDRRVTFGVRVNPEKGCCRFVNPLKHLTLAKATTTIIVPAQKRRQ